jgi:hypothetical protein
MSDLASRVTGLSSTQLEDLVALPGQIETLIRTAQATIQAIENGEDPSNPLSALFGSLGEIAESAENVPGIQDLLGRVRELIDELPTGDIGDLGAITRAVEGVLEMFGPVRETLLSGDIAGAVERAAGRVQELVSGFGQGGGDPLSRLTGSLGDFFRLFGQVARFREAPPSSDELAELLCRAFVGAPLDVLSGASSALEESLAPLESLLPRGAELAAWQGAGGEIARFWQDLDARLSSDTLIDWTSIRTELEGARTRLLVLNADRDRLAANLVSSLGSTRLDGFSRVTSALANTPALVDQRLSPLIDGVRGQLRGMVDGLGSLAPTEVELRRLVRDFIQDVLAYLDRSPLGELRSMMINFQQALIDAVESLPFRDLSRQLEQLLLQAARAVDLIDPEVLRRPVREVFDGIRERVEGLPTADIQAAVGQLWAGVETALNEVSELIERFRDTAAGAVSNVEGFLDAAQPTLQQISDQVAEIKRLLEEFDLNQPADAVIAEIERLRDKVAELDLSEVPEAARGALDVAVQALAGIDITAAVRGPLDDALAKVDPTPLLESAASSLSGATSVLASVNPEHLVRELDRPVDEIIAAIRAFGPEELERLLQQALEPVKAAIRALDFQQLFAPLTRIFAELTARIDGVLNPDLIFRPLEELFQPVVDLVDALSPTRLIDLLTPHAGGVASSMNGAAGAPSSLPQGAASLRQTITSSVADAEGELFGFRPGDLLVPLIDLHRKLMEMLDEIPDEILGPAFARLHSATRGGFDALDPRNIELRVGARMSALGSEFDLVTLAERLEPASDVYRSAATKLGAAAREASLEDRERAADALAIVPELDPMNLMPVLAQTDSVQQAVQRFTTGLDLDELRLGFAAFSPRWSGALPTFLGAAETGVETARAALRALDPAPLRDEINRSFDELGAKVVGLQDALLGALEELAIGAERYFLPFTPASLIALANRLHTATKEQVLAFSPATFKDEVKAIFDVVKRQLGVLDPSFLAGEFDELRESLFEKLDEVVAAIAPPTGAFDEVLERIGDLRPSRLLAGVVDELKPLTDLINQLDPASLLTPIIDAIAHVREQIPGVLSRLEAALDEVLLALTRGGAAGGNAQLGASAAA